VCLRYAGQMWTQISAVSEDMLREQIAEVLNANKPAWIAGLNLDRRALPPSKCCLCTSSIWLHVCLVRPTTLRGACLC